MNKAVIAASTVLLLSYGCGADRTQNAANAIAGIQALGMLAPADAQPIVTGASDYVVACAGTKNLPEPTRKPEEILQDRSGYEQDGGKAMEESLSGWQWLASIGGGIVAVLGFLRFLPGTAGPIAGMAQGLIGRLIGSREERRAIALEKQAKDVLPAVLAMLDHACASSADMSRIRDDILSSVPDDLIDAAKGWAIDRQPSA